MRDLVTPATLAWEREGDLEAQEKEQQSWRDVALAFWQSSARDDEETRAKIRKRKLHRTKAYEWLLAVSHMVQIATGSQLTRFQQVEEGEDEDEKRKKIQKEPREVERLSFASRYARTRWRLLQRLRRGSIVPCGVGLCFSRPTRLRRGPRYMSDRSTWVVAGQEVAHGGRIALVSLDRAEERIRTATVHAAYVRNRFDKPDDTRELATHANVERKLQDVREGAVEK